MQRKKSKMNEISKRKDQVSVCGHHNHLHTPTPSGGWSRNVFCPLVKLDIFIQPFAANIFAYFEEIV